MGRRITTRDLVGLSPQHAQFVIEYCKDFATQRAAEAAGFSPEYGYHLRDRDDITLAISNVLNGRLETSDIDAEWHLHECVDNHRIARQRGKLSASNQALRMIGQHVLVDSFAANKVDVEVNTDTEVQERLMRGRQRARERGTQLPSPPPAAEEPSFF